MTAGGVSVATCTPRTHRAMAASLSPAVAPLLAHELIGQETPAGHGGWRVPKPQHAEPTRQ